MRLVRIVAIIFLMGLQKSRGFSTIRSGLRPRVVASQQNNHHGIPTTVASSTNRSPFTVLSAVPVATATVLVPSIKSIALACLIPTLSGYYKSEYGVSYAYGLAMATTASLVLKRITTLQSIAGVHALALLVYGVRLVLFLLYRELRIPYFREMRERIESKATSRGPRLARTPFILSCALLYACMAAPMLITANCAATTPFFSLQQCSLWTLVARALVSMTWMGFIVAMVGDFTKTIVKARKGPDHLVTEGVFCILRHPNYVGEWLGWTSSGLLAVLWGASQWGNIASILGVLGIDLVLIQATTALEAKQREKYGQSESYQKWVKRSWAGFTIKTKGEGEASTATDNVESSKK